MHVVLSSTEGVVSPMPDVMLMYIDVEGWTKYAEKVEIINQKMNRDIRLESALRKKNKEKEI